MPPNAAERTSYLGMEEGKEVRSRMPRFPFNDKFRHRHCADAGQSLEKFNFQYSFFFPRISSVMVLFIKLYIQLDCTFRFIFVPLHSNSSGEARMILEKYSRCIDRPCAGSNSCAGEPCFKRDAPCRIPRTIIRFGENNSAKVCTPYLLRNFPVRLRKGQLRDFRLSARRYSISVRKR